MMARKQILFATVLVLLAIASWRILRTSRDESAATLAPGNGPASNLAPKHELALDSDSASRERTANPGKPIAAGTAAEAEASAGFALRGAIVDARRFAAADLDVQLVREDGTSMSVRSDAAGHFSFAIPARAPKSESVVLWAVHGGEAAVKATFLPGSRPRPFSGFLHSSTPLGDVDAGTLTLQPATRVEVSVVEAGQPVAGAEVRVWLGVDATVVWRGTTAASGTASTPPLPSGVTNVDAQRGEADGHVRVFLPVEHRALVELAPRFEAAITLVDKATSKPIEGVAVELSELLSAPSFESVSSGFGFGEFVTTRRGSQVERITDGQGVARFPGLSKGCAYYVRSKSAGYSEYPPSGSSGERVGADKPTPRIELVRVSSRTVRWPIETGEVPPPPEGARIALRFAPGMRHFRDEADAQRSAGVVRDGHVVAEGVIGGTQYLATAPDGSIAAVWVDERSDVGKTASFRKPRTIEVVVRDVRGAPVADAQAMARNQGNNALGPPARSGDDGIARVTGLHGSLTDVYVLGPPPAVIETQAGTVDLEKGDGRVEVVIPDHASMRARLAIRIDGAAQLPGEYELRGAATIAEHPETGELELSMNLPEKDEAISVGLAATGFLPASVKFAAVRDGSEARLTVDLVRGATLTAHVTMPASKTRVQMRVQMWSEEKRAFGGVPNYFNGLHTPNGAGGSFRFFQLAAGRYQVLDEVSKSASDAVELTAGQTEAEVTLDLANLEWVSGRVELPDAAELPRVRVLASMPGAHETAAWLPGMSPPEGTRPAADGTFRIQARRGVRTHLKAWHPWLAAADPGGQIDVEGGREGVVLHLVDGDQVRIAAPQLKAKPRFQAARVALYAAEVSGEPRAWLHAPLVDGSLRFTGVPPGRATLWIDPGDEFAPLVLRDVEIVAGVTDLGVATFAHGSSLRTKLQPQAGQVASRIYVSARRARAPALFRSINSNGESEVVLTGLEAGVYTVSCHSIMGTQGKTDREIEVDGVNEVELVP